MWWQSSSARFWAAGYQRSRTCRSNSAGRGRRRRSQFEYEVRHVVLVAIGIRPVLGNDERFESELPQSLDGIGFQVGNHHAVQMSQAAFARDVDEVIYHR